MLQRKKIIIKGAVQGVGFRPFIYKLAKSLSLKGYVLNNPQGVIIEAEGDNNTITEFIDRIEKEKPPVSLIQNISVESLIPLNSSDFKIEKSDLSGPPNAIILPDIATCNECLEEIFEKENRRYLYPFTNCTNCGPRYSIIESLPYDRARTTMKIFSMCPECLNEYNNPDDRRFHAQPNACPVCGPHIEIWDKGGNILSSGHDAIPDIVKAIRSGKIAAIKGLGGFHLFVDAMDGDAIKRLRKNKGREEKPFALMYPDLLMIKRDCYVSYEEELLLLSAQAPIILLKKKSACIISPEAAPLNPNLGVMLPYTPLHHIIMHYLNTPVIATSGNLSEEPICIDEKDALKRLKDIADLFLVHNRPIYRHVDDSIVRVILKEKTVLRRARGYAPMPVIINNKSDEQILSVGGHLKNTIAVSKGTEVFISQHIGDLETKESYNSFLNTIDKFNEIYKIKPDAVICDSHPDYISAKYARENFSNVTSVQHHASHILSVIAENDLTESILGISWDGAGFGLDGTIWGGEFLIFDRGGFKRIAHIKKFRLPGGESSFKEIYKSAFGILYEIYGDKVIDNIPESVPIKDSKILLNMIKKEINSPECTSVGRLYDGIASILGIRQKVNFEGQAAMELEFLTDGIRSDDRYEFSIIKSKDGMMVLDWEKLIKQIIKDKRNKISLNIISIKFHNALVKGVVDIAKSVNEKNVALSGGCFQNKYLLENSIQELRKNGFNVYWNKEVPANDGGISLGQIAYFSYFRKNK